MVYEVGCGVRCVAWGGGVVRGSVERWEVMFLWGKLLNGKVLGVMWGGLCFFWMGGVGVWGFVSLGCGVMCGVCGGVVVRGG